MFWEQISGYQWESEEGRGNIGVEEKRGYYGIKWNLVCKTFENSKALRNLKNRWFDQKLINQRKSGVGKKLWLS